MRNFATVGKISGDEKKKRRKETGGDRAHGFILNR